MKKLILSLLLISCTNKPPIPQSQPETIILPEQKIVIIDVPPMCPNEMVEINGNYCTKIQHKCKEWQDPPSTKKRFRRCKTYQKATCKSKQNPMAFCIDKQEFPEKTIKEEKGKFPEIEKKALPMTNVSWNDARYFCAFEGKRLCSDEEWTLACEGPELYAHPYGNTRNQNICYHDKILADMIDKRGELIDLRKPIDTHPECLSPYGVQNMTGNVGEWTFYEEGGPGFRSGGKGGWWNSGLRSRCRPITVGHDENFKQVQIGFRCCKDF